MAEELPNNLNFNSGVDFINQIISYERVTFWGYLMDMIKGGSKEEDPRKVMIKKPEIVFGRRKPEESGRKNLAPSALAGGGSPSPSSSNLKLSIIER